MVLIDEKQVEKCFRKSMRQIIQEDYDAFKDEVVSQFGHIKTL